MNNIIIGNTNITDYIISDSYKMDAEDQYESWRDGNYVEHRIIVTSKVRGSFQIPCSNKPNSITFADLMSAIDEASDNGIIQCSVFVTNRNEMRAISAYYKLENESHILLADKTFLDVITVELTER